MQISNCTIFGDMDYLSASVQLNLFESVNINLQTPIRKNQIGYVKQLYVFIKSRKRIETLYSQLGEQFMIKRNYAKSFSGFRIRILSKTSALTMIQYLNKFVFDSHLIILSLICPKCTAGYE